MERNNTVEEQGVERDDAAVEDYNDDLTLDQELLQELLDGAEERSDEEPDEDPKDAGDDAPNGEDEDEGSGEDEDENDGDDQEDEVIDDQKKFNKALGKRLYAQEERIRGEYQEVEEKAGLLDQLFPGMTAEEIVAAMQKQGEELEAAGVKKIMEEEGIESERVAKSIYRAENPPPQRSQAQAPPARQNDRDAELADQIMRDTESISQQDPEFDPARFIEENPGIVQEMAKGKSFLDVYNDIKNPPKQKESEKDIDIEKALEEAYKRGAADAYKKRKKASTLPAPLNTDGKATGGSDYYEDDELDAIERALEE